MTSEIEPKRAELGAFERYSRYFYDPARDDAEHWDFRRRAKVLVLSCHLGALLIAIALTLRAASGALPSKLYAAVACLAAVAMFCAPLVLKQTQSVCRAAMLPLAALAVMLPVLLAQSGGLDAPSMALVPALPVIAAFFTGFRVAAAFAALLALETLGLSATTSWGWIHPVAAPAALKTMLIIAYVGATTSVAFVYERERRDVEQKLQALARALYEASIRDPLTGLFNRRHFDECLQSELAYSRRHGSPLSLLLIDVDHFKQVNDELGHAAGDSVLTGVAALLRLNLRQEDVLARAGGEEFAVLMRETDSAGARAAAERLRAAVAGHAFEFSARHIGVTVSIGGVSAAGEASDGVALLSRADARMYLAKRDGRNRVVTADPAEAA